MGLKIFHTSDIHLGMKFASYPEVQKELSEARLNTLEILVEISNTGVCDIFVVAGDLSTGLLYQRVMFLKLHMP